MIKKQHTFDFCVVGGGMAGLIAAISAARKGVKTAIIQDRPVFGGNASSEIRMHICGARGENMRETGILEEILLENHYRNPQPNFSIWDSVLHGKAMCQENLTVFLNCSVYDCSTQADKITSVKAWQFTCETQHDIMAALFADCTGDGILAPLSGAAYRIGREARDEYNESIAPVTSDKKTMGMTCLFQAREFTNEQTFIPPDWAYKYTQPKDLEGRNINIRMTNFWWMEVGGEHDSIHDAEELRDELLKIAFGVWDHIKNYSAHKEEFKNWGLDWLGFLPGKRESRRYIGAHVLTQNDVKSKGTFDDIVAYGGWTMDDHFPAGFYGPATGTTHHHAPSPFGIPYRTLYSNTIKNLFCAGRCHSASHTAMSATRVMATTSLMGQAVGTAAALAVKNKLTPSQIYSEKIGELQQILMEDDCYLPGKKRKILKSCLEAALSASDEQANINVLRNGIDRPVGEEKNYLTCKPGSTVTYTFDTTRQITEVKIICDSDLDRKDIVRGPNFSARNMRHFYALDAPKWKVPGTILKQFSIQAQNENGTWETIFSEINNYQRFLTIPLTCKTKAVRLLLDRAWDCNVIRLFAFEIK